jgi:membrane protein DedA with SNARE-associated domain
MIAGTLSDLTDWLDRISSHWWFLVIIGLIAFFDSVVPVVPSETCVIIGGVAASRGNQSLLIVIAIAALGAFLGDNTAFHLGFRASERLRRRAERKPRFATKMAWAREQIHRRGGLLLITARFIPGGRTALTLSCGITRQRRAWFIRWVVVATLIWASYAALLGRIGGEAFKDDHTKAFLFAFGLAIGTNILIEIGRHMYNRRKSVAAAS